MKAISIDSYKGISKNPFYPLFGRGIKVEDKTKTGLLEMRDKLKQVVITVQLAIITLAMPSASLADVSFYTTLVSDYFKILRYNFKYDVAVLIKATYNLVNSKLTLMDVCCKV